MRHVKWLTAAGLVVATTAGCTQTAGYPGTYYSGGPAYVQSGYGYSSPSYGYTSPSYYGSSYYTPTYTRPVVNRTVVNRTVVNRVVQPRTPRDRDNDGVPNRRDRFDNNPRRN